MAGRIGCTLGVIGLYSGATGEPASLDNAEVVVVVAGLATVG